jgi:hypothetical protein
VKSLGGYYESRRARPKGVEIVGVVAGGTAVEKFAANAFVDGEREGDVR